MVSSNFAFSFLIEDHFVQRLFIFISSHILISFSYVQKQEKFLCFFILEGLWEPHPVVSRAYSNLGVTSSYAQG